MNPHLVYGVSESPIDIMVLDIFLLSTVLVEDRPASLDLDLP